LHGAGIRTRCLDYKTHVPPLIYIPLCCHIAKSRGSERFNFRSFTTMAVNNSTAALPATVKKNDNEFKLDVSPVTPSSQVEPIVTRRELWSYYRKCHASRA